MARAYKFVLKPTVAQSRRLEALLAAQCYPRFRSRSRFESVSWPDRHGWALDTEQSRFRVQGVGQIKVRLHRRLGGVPKTPTLRREGPPLGEVAPFRGRDGAGRHGRCGCRHHRR